MHTDEILRIDSRNRSRPIETDRRLKSREAEVSNYWTKDDEAVCQDVATSVATPGFNTRMASRGASYEPSVASTLSPKSGGVIAGTTITQIITTSNERPKDLVNEQVSAVVTPPSQNDNNSSLTYSKIITKEGK